MKNTKKRSESKSNIEKISENLITESVTTLLATYVGTPLAALLPVLTKSLASSRHRKRIEVSIVEVNKTLNAHEKQLQHLSDAQYKIINETILSIFQTTQEEKLKYLRDVIKNTLTNNDVNSHQAVILSRIIRDISADELEFLLRNLHYHRIQLTKENDISKLDKDNLLCADPDAIDGILVSGLISMGLLIPGDPTWNDSGRYRYSPIVIHLVRLVE